MTFRKPFRERRHRLEAHAYRGQATVVFTACMQDRREIFRDIVAAQTSIQCLRVAADKYNCEVLAYCLMPDHAHVILRGRSGPSDPRRAFVAFKQATGYWMAKNRPGVGWQKDFYDHVLRTDEDLLPSIRYIVENPVRKGLVADWRAYPFTGSFVFDLEGVLGK
jgi:REP element-mobilizing transposase RayT